MRIFSVTFPIASIVGLFLIQPVYAAPKKNIKSAPAAVKEHSPATVTKNLDGSKRVALVIGNSAYVNAPLKNPVNDAKDIASKLRALDFEVIERNNLTTRQIGGTLREFRSKLTPGAVALVFYAGHGLQIKGENYLPAVDADINFEEDVPNQSLSVKQLMDVLDESKSRLNLVFLDACRNNPYARSFRSGDRGLARVSAPSGTLISYATKPGSVAADGTGRNGLYTSKLLAQMDSNQQIELSLKRVVTDVKAASNGKQEPWMEGSIEGDFCFGGCGENSAVVTQSVSTEPVSKLGQSTGQDSESALWTEVKAGNSKDDYDAYLAQYPKGKYVALAKSRIKKIQDEVAAEVNRKELAAWELAEKTATEEAYQNYLNNYRTGQFVSLVPVRIAKVKENAKLQEEDELWKRSLETANRGAMQAYLEKYPNGRYEKEARQKDEEYQRVPVRPQLPFEIREDIWRTLETSAAYRNMPQPRVIRINSQANVQTNYTGSKSASLPKPAAYNKSMSKEVTPLGGKCSEHKNTFAQLKTTTSVNTYICGFVPLASQINGKSGTITKSLEMNGSLFPLRIGAEQSERVANSYIPDSKYDSTSQNTCRVTGKTSANDLHPKLTGVAWTMSCENTFNMPGGNMNRTTVTENYYLEDLGVFLSDIGELDSLKNKFVLPVPGTQTVLVAEGEYGSRTTSTYQSYDWSVVK